MIPVRAAAEVVWHGQLSARPWGVAYAIAPILGAFLGVVAAHTMCGLPLMRLSANGRLTPGESLAGAGTAGRQTCGSWRWPLALDLRGASADPQRNAATDVLCDIRWNLDLFEQRSVRCAQALATGVPTR